MIYLICLDLLRIPSSLPNHLATLAQAKRQSLLSSHIKVILSCHVRSIIREL